jgi:hypothetical protein
MTSERCHGGEDIQKLVMHVTQISRNIEEGFCPVQLSAVYFFCNSLEVLNKGSTRILVNRKKSESGTILTEDVKVLEQLCDEFHGRGYIHELHQTGKYITGGIPKLSQFAVDDKLISLDQRTPFSNKLKVWLDGVPWSKLNISSSNRPSLASWIGYPYEVAYIMEKQRCGLGRSIPKSAIDIIEEKMSPAQLVPSNHLDMFQPIWTEESGTVEDVEAAVLKSIEFLKSIEKKKHDETEQKQIKLAEDTRTPTKIPYSVQIMNALTALKSKDGSSRRDIISYLKVPPNEVRTLTLALRSGVENGSLEKTCSRYKISLPPQRISRSKPAIPKFKKVGKRRKKKSSATK